MKIAITSLLAVGLLFGTCTVQAQSTTMDSSNTNTSNANANTSSGASSVNQGVTAVVNQTNSGQVNYSGRYSVDSQVPVSVVGYGSFSQISCQNSVGMGATTKIFSFVYNGPHKDINCEHAVRSNQFGQESQLAAQRGYHRQAEILRSMGVWETCTSNKETEKACLQMGLIQQTQGEDKHGRPIAVAAPAPQLKRFVQMPEIPSRPKGWTNKEYLQQQKQQQQAQNRPATNEETMARVTTRP